MNPHYIAKLLKEAAEFVERHASVKRHASHEIALQSKLEIAAKQILEEDDQEVRAKFGAKFPPRN